MDTRTGSSSPSKHSRRKRAVVVLALLAGLNLVLWPAMLTRYPDAISGLGMTANAATAGPHNGFDIANAVVPQREIFRGGPPRDGIPAILDPIFVRVSEARKIEDTDQVLAFAHGGVARAYPLRILVWHEIVNDVVGGLPIAATYCPLCGTCMVFSREVEGDILTLGVSGLLYNSDMLMYDHETESLWSQLQMASIAGEQVGTTLPWLPSEQTTWGAWRDAHPDGEVLSFETGFNRDYGRDPYARYAQTDEVMMPVAIARKELPNKTWVVGTIIKGIPKAYPLSGLDTTPIVDDVDDESVVITYEAESRAATITREDGTRVPHVMVYWFAWQAFYPETLLFTAE